jgi:hypothetical protein
VKSNIEKGNDLESYVQYVYSVLLNLKGENIIVSKKADMQDVFGVTHNIDVFYQFEKANIQHKVAFECKNWNTPVTKEKVAAFVKIIEDIKGVVGVIVSNKGYQSGAQQYANAHRIITLTIEQLPNILDLLSMQITKYFLPNKEDIGEPFWTIMELNEVGEINGNYYSMQPNEQGHQNGIALFFSKIDAEIHLSKMPDKKKWAVRGLRQYNLKAILEFSKKIHDYTFYIVRSIVTIQDSNYMVQKLNDKKLQKEYLHIK